MLLMVENGIRGEICQAIYSYVKANNKYINNYDKTQQHHISCIWMEITCMDVRCLKSVL